LPRDRSAPPRPRIYLAGPEVFLPDAIAVGGIKQELCARHGFEGVFPLDNTLDVARLPKRQQAQRISAANEALMRTCAALIANLTPFRGVSMDCGTAFEVGFMRALGRPVLGYTNVVADYRRRAEAYRRVNVPVAEADAGEVAVEDYDLAENLMVEAAIQASGGEVIRRGVPRGREMRDLAAFEACLIQAQRVVLA
jgi:nucleoside 2-deoxyribosyltransferase